jgi:hypothetical protein
MGINTPYLNQCGRSLIATEEAPSPTAKKEILKTGLASTLNKPPKEPGYW